MNCYANLVEGFRSLSKRGPNAYLKQIDGRKRILEKRFHCSATEDRFMGAK